MKCCLCVLYLHNVNLLCIWSLINCPVQISIYIWYMVLVFIYLKVLKLQSLKERREDLCLKFAKKCLEVPKLQKMFPRSQQNHAMGKRSTESFMVKRGLTERMRRSAIPYMQRLLNEDYKKKKDICRQITNYKPVNNDFVYKSVSLRD